MKRKLLSTLLCAAMTAALLAGCGSNSDSGTDDQKQEEQSESSDEGGSDAGKTYAIITKSAGNPYNEKEADGFKEVIEAQGATCIVMHPEAATADAQVSVIQSLVSQNVDAICIAGNDENALQASLEEAMAAGIKVSCLDAKVNPDSRQTFVNQAGTKEIGQALMDAVLDLSGGCLLYTSDAADER